MESVYLDCINDIPSKEECLIAISKGQKLENMSFSYEFIWKSIQAQMKQDEVYSPWGGFFSALKGDITNPHAIEFQENAYLNFLNDSRISNFAKEGIDLYGEGTQRSEAYQRGDINNPSMALQEKFSFSTGMKSSLLTMNGWLANFVYLTAVGGGDPKKGMNIYMDQDAHPSLRDPAKNVTHPFETFEHYKKHTVKDIPIPDEYIYSLVDNYNSQYTHLHFFKHNDIDDLSLLIKKYGPGVIVTEEIFSVYGDNGNIGDIAQVARDTRSLLHLDIAHSFGIAGKPGQMGGFAVEQGISGTDIDCKTISSSKAMSLPGGALTTNNEVISEWIARQNALVFSTAPAMSISYATNKALDIVNEVDGASVRQLAQYFRELLWAEGISVRGGDSGLVFLEVGKKDSTISFRDALTQGGVLSSVYVPPATHPKKCGVRFNFRLGITPYQIRETVEVIKGILKQSEFEYLQKKWKTPM